MSHDFTQCTTIAERISQAPAANRTDLETGRRFSTRGFSGLTPPTHYLARLTSFIYSRFVRRAAIGNHSHPRAT
jgi:hypothetical protein